MAVAGMSFFSASGDDGASDCHRLGFNGLAVDDPAGQPYATGVGGTTLHTGPFTRERLGRARRGQRRRGRRRLEHLPHAVVAGGPRRDPDRPVEQDEVRRQDRVLPRGAGHRVQRQPEHRVRHQRRHLGHRRRHVGGGAADGRLHGRRRHVQPRQRRHPDGLREPVPLPRGRRRPGDVPRRHDRQQQHPHAGREVRGGAALRHGDGLGLDRREPDGDRPGRTTRARRPRCT